jgi:ATP adenylyltransferase
MKNLWAPWRMAYIESATEEARAKTGKVEECIFCRYPSEPRDRDRDNLVLHRAERGFVMLNRFPYSNAHLLVVPYAHVKDLSALDPAVHDDLFRLTTKMTELLESAVRCDGINLGMNLGHAAGAGIANHLHVHLVPRWNGDTNFMPILGEAKVIGEHLLTTYDRLASLL